MTGECKKLGKPIGIMRKKGGRNNGGGEGDVDMDSAEGVDRTGEEELEIVEVVRYKIVFSARPEPISGVVEE